MERLGRDLRYALRGLRRSPTFTAVAVATIALGVGVTATVFSLVNAVLLRPLPGVERPAELVNVYGRGADASDHSTHSYLDYLDYREQAESLAGVLAYTNFFASLSVEGSAELVVGELVSRDYFQVLGVRAGLGRTFAPDEHTTPGASPVAVLSHPFWQTRFGGDPGILGRTFRLNGRVYTVVGVAPEGFGGMFPGAAVQMWIPLSMVDEVEPLGANRVSGPFAGPSFLESRGRRFLWMRGRIASGSDLARVRTELEAIAARLAEQYPETNERERIVVLRTADVAVNPDLDGTLAPAGLVLLAAVGLVLIVACANLANATLARGAVRRRELAIRLALGARQGALVRQLLTESLLLALLGGGAALLLSGWLSAAVMRLKPPLPIELQLDFAPDLRVWAFTFAVAVLTGVAFGLLPALRASRPDLVPALKDTGGGDGARRRRLEVRDVLVVAQVALSVVLLLTGALLVRSLGAAARVDLGYDADRLAYLSLAMEMNGLEAEEAADFLAVGTARLAALPEVVAVGRASRIPMSLNYNGFSLYVDGHQGSADDRPYTTDGAQVDEGYLGVLGARLVAGRGIEAADRDQGLRVAVLNETLAGRIWPGQDPVGREFRRSWGGEPWRVIGVVEDYKVDTPGEAAKPYLHVPLAARSGSGDVLMRTTADAAGLVPRLERELQTLRPGLVFIATGTVRELAEVRVFPIRAAAWLIGGFGLLAVLLAALGLYGVIAYAVARRVPEMGIRKALGARSGDVAAMVVRQGMTRVAVGAVVGAVLAFGAARALSGVLFVPASDPASLGAAMAILAAVSALANWIPARRASRVDPVKALKAG